MDKTFTITCTMNERWIDTFLSMLKYMEVCGNIGHSALIGFYSDGDGDFHPKFESDIEFERDDGFDCQGLNPESFTPERIYDAG